MIKSYDMIVHSKGKELEKISVKRGVIRFKKQTTNYTCGPSALSSLASLFGIKISEQKLARDLGTKPLIGTCHSKILDFANKYLPVTAYGEGDYEGGLGIANIISPFSGIGHFVILLARKGNYIRYYCPSIGRVVTIHKKALRWQNSSGSINNWHISVAGMKDMFSMT